MKILLTGATGFIGSVLLNYVVKAQHQVVAVSRKLNNPDLSSDQVFIDSIGVMTDWCSSLLACDVVIHCAARAHIMSDEASDPLAAYREVNTAGTLNLAKQAADAGVKRFIFISSIKVNGESTTNSPKFLETDQLVPDDPYGLSKYEAEAGLRDIAQETDMEVVIIRPPLVYGSGVRANFLNLIKLAATKYPLPFGLIANQRSMIYVNNLADFIVKCIDHPNAANQIFLVSDGRDLSLRELLILLRKAMGRSARLLPVPEYMFRFAGVVTGKRELVDRLTGSLQVDSNKAQKLLNWRAPYTVEEGIQTTVDDFLNINKKNEACENSMET